MPEAIKRVLDSRTSARDADDVGGVGTRGSGEGICLRQLLHDQYSRRAALDSSPDDNQHELLTSVPHWNTSALSRQL